MESFTELEAALSAAVARVDAATLPAERARGASTLMDLATRAHTAAAETRLAALQQLREGGSTTREMGKIVGLTHGRIVQVLQRGQRSDPATATATATATAIGSSLEE